MTLPELEDRTGLRFPNLLRAADFPVMPELRQGREPLGGVEEIR